MNTPLRVLILEDRPADLELVVHELRRAGFAADWQSVDNEADFLAQLHPALDVILADYSLPSWDAPHALRALQERGLDIPFIMISGTVGEEIAVECIKLGAVDYLLKDRLARLGPAIVRALADKRLREEKRQAEAALRESEEKFRNLFNNAEVGMFRTRIDGSEILDVNEKFLEIFGRTREEVQGFPSVIHWADPREREEMVGRLKAEGRVIDFECRMLNKQGQVRTCITSLRLFDEQGSLEGSILDITDRKQAEEALRESEKRVRTVLENMPVMLDALDENLNIIVWNKECERVTGYSEDEIIHHSRVSELLYPDPVYRERMQTDLATRGDYRNWEWEVTCKDGSVKTISWSNISHQYPIPGWAHWGIGVDITDLKHAEHAERSARILAEALAETASGLTQVLDLDAVMNTILENLARVVPHDAANIMLIDGDQARVAYWRDYRPESIASLDEFSIPLTGTRHLELMLVTRSPFLAEHTDQHPDWVRGQHTEWVNSYLGVPIQSHDRVIGFLNVDSATPGFFTADHTQRLQSFADQASVAIEHAQLYEEIRRHAAELEQRVEERTAQLNHVKERIEAILNSSSDVMILCRMDSTIDQINPAFYETFGYALDDLYNQPLTTLAIPEHAGLLGQTFETVVQIRKPQRVEVTVCCQDRGSFDADIVLSPVVGADRQLFGVMCSLRDITERKQMEVRLRQMLDHEAELSELKSRYVSMAAHDLRNPLAVIGSSLDLLQSYGDRLPEERKQTKYKDIRTSITIMVSLLDDILTIGQVESGKLTFNPAPQDVIAFCQGLVTEVSQAAGTAQSIVFSSQGSCRGGQVDVKLLRHILGNLLSNALKYSPGDREVLFSVDCRPDQITFRVEDHGIGIPEADQKRLFETFHRARNVRQIPGTGLGLAIVKQSVELHGGTITYESQEGVGTTFTVTLPQASGGQPTG
jgi:PAS domain S-box-containing protein